MPLGDPNIVQVEVYACKHHEYDYYNLYIRAGKVSHTGIVVGKASRTHCPEGVDESIVPAHTAEFKQYYLCSRKSKIELIKSLCSIGKSCGNFILYRSGSLRICNHLTAYSKYGKEGHYKDNYPHTSQPVGEGTPEKNGFRKRLYIR